MVVTFPSQHTLEDLLTYPIPDLAELLRRETAEYVQYRPSDDRPGLALFRIALGRQRESAKARAEQAWYYLYQQYRPLVVSWFANHANALIEQETADALVNETFAKFFQAFIDPAKIERFESLAELIGYLKTCVFSVIIDAQRVRKLRRQTETLETLGHQLLDADPAESVIDGISLQALWQIVADELHSEDERLLFTLIYIREWKPQEIQRHYPARFSSINEIYQLKRNMLERLRRSKRLRAYRTGTLASVGSVASKC